MVIALYSIVGLSVLFLSYLVFKLAGALALALMVCAIPSALLLLTIIGGYFFFRRRLMRKALAGRRSR